MEEEEEPLKLVEEEGDEDIVIEGSGWRGKAKGEERKMSVVKWKPFQARSPFGFRSAAARGNTQGTMESSSAILDEGENRDESTGKKRGDTRSLFLF